MTLINNDVMVSIVITAITTLLGGGLLGAIFTGLSTKATIKQSNADALATYQKIADLASKSELDARVRERESQDKSDVIIQRLESEALIRSNENTRLKRVISTWSDGIQILHNQMREKEITPRWKPNADDLAFLSK